MIDILSEIGEILCLGFGLLFIFTLLHSLFSTDSVGNKTQYRSGGNKKGLIPIIGIFFGICIGVYLGNIFSETWAIVGAICLGLAGLLISISMSKQVQDF
ncbi:MAG: hypothetical protein ACK2U1_10505 [Anaerolineales bacterium]